MAAYRGRLRQLVSAAMKQSGVTSALSSRSPEGQRRRAAENGATSHQLTAMFGWLTIAAVERAAERLAKDALRLLKR